MTRPTREEFRRTLWRAALPPLLLLAGLAAFVSLVMFRLQQMAMTESGLNHDRFEQFQHASVVAVLAIVGISMSLGIWLALINRRNILRLTTVYQQALESEDARATELAASQKQLLDLAEAIPQLVWISDSEGKPVYFNSPWGTSIEQLTERGWEDALHPEDSELARVRWKESLRTGQPFEAEYRIKRNSDGTYRWFLCRAMPVRDKSGKNIRWFGSCTDIETQKQVEQQREAVLAAERKARSDLLRTNQLKDQFLATLSHELRTPMTAILGWTQLLQDPAIREKNLDRAIEAIETNARAQERLIEDLLDVSRILSGKLTIKLGVVDLRAVVKAAVDAVGPAAMAKQVRLLGEFADADFKLQGDAARLQQVVANLLSNAVKFTPVGGTVTVRLNRTDHTAQLQVDDTGRGIRPEFLPYVFERFRQADGSTTRQHGGLGLGLAIVKHLVDLHGGHVRADSAGEDRGATFTVDMPLTAPAVAPPAPVESTAPPAEPVSLEGIRVLLVEDDRDACEVVQVLLQRAGATVECEHSAITGLERLRADRFDVLISDIGMPGMDGYGLIRRLREIETTLNHKTPAIALTAFANKDDREEALNAGYQMHLAKPVAAEEMTRAVASLVKVERQTVHSV
jgi:PAS domain S-box-containing protein